MVESDTKVIECLTKNRDINKCNFEILNKFISDKNKNIEYDDNNGYATKTVNYETKNDLQITYLEFKKQYPLQFNVLICDYI